jgi:hypothetical protein
MDREITTAILISSLNVLATGRQYTYSTCVLIFRIPVMPSQTPSVSEKKSDLSEKLKDLLVEKHEHESHARKEHNTSKSVRSNEKADQ